jgi:small GTP-binding protein
MVTTVLKTAVIGARCCGKTSLCNAITEKTVYKDYISTIGVDYFVKHFERKNDTVSLSLWDLTGNDSFEHVIESYVRSCPVLIFCYNANEENTFRELEYNHKLYKKKNIIQNKKIIIVVTKIDSDKFIDYEIIGKEFSEKYNYPFIKTSAYTKEGINQLISTFLNFVPEPIILEPLNKNTNYNWCIIS